MKILLKKKESVVKIFHDPREIIIKPKGQEVEIFNYDGTVLEHHKLINKELDWLENSAIDSSEIIVKLEIE